MNFDYDLGIISFYSNNTDLILVNKSFVNENFIQVKTYIIKTIISIHIFSLLIYFLFIRKHINHKHN